MLKLTEYPSILLRSYVIPFWIQLLSIQDKKEIIPSNEILNLLFQLILSQLDPITMDENANDPIHIHLEDDFSKEEFSLFEVRFSFQLRKLITEITKIRPLITLQLVNNNINYFGGPDSSKINEILKFCYAGISKEHLQNETISAITQNILAKVFTINDKNPQIIQYQAEIIHNCSLYFHFHTDSIFPIANKVIFFSFLYFYFISSCNS